MSTKEAAPWESPTIGSASRTLTMCRAQREAVEWEMAHDPRVFMVGEDISGFGGVFGTADGCLLYTSPSPRDGLLSRMPSSA